MSTERTNKLWLIGERDSIKNKIINRILLLALCLYGGRCQWNRNYIPMRKVLLISLFLLGCTSNGLPRIEHGRQVNFVFVPSSSSQQKTDIDSQIADKYSETGSGIGAGAGLMWATACGPFYLICSMATVPVASLAGGVGGHVAGDLASLPEFKRKKLIEQLEKNRRKIELNTEVVGMLNKHAGSKYNVSYNEQAKRIEFKIQDFSLIILEREKIKLSMTVRVRTRKDRSKPKLEKKHYTQYFYYESATESVDKWIEDKDYFVIAEFRKCLDNLASEIIKEISS
ncbi:hypothetical protein [Thalassotalea sp. ND16A]|uniref:hypothetical protein n=1 Tax=Thalassotalea sp. ND16A TaxID=1535422 RepID=UPI00051A0C72|nr:hypothetical protein [Thalassotalea sp. ND16A]KGJ95835.1 hypothetical protein ND16A_1370 [Thalassotalea sp. ND16A]